MHEINGLTHFLALLALLSSLYSMITQFIEEFSP